MSQGTVSVPIQELRVGVTCSHPIEDDSGILLLGARTPITDHVIDGLRDRGIHSVEIDPRDLAAMKGAAKGKRKAQQIGKVDAIKDPNRALKTLLVDRFDENLSEQRTERLLRQFDEGKEQYSRLEQKLSTEKLRSVDGLTTLAEAYIDSIVDDHDQTLGSIGSLDCGTMPDAQSLRMSVLGMAIATEMGLSGPQIHEVGMTAMLHDIGLLAMGERFRRPVEAMSDEERWEYRKHPLVSALCIADVTEVPQSVQLAMQQVHEQFDGSGYPRGLKGQRIHLYARILNVADAYLRLISPTTQRSAIVPHDAMAMILHQAGRGFFDPQVIRCLLQVECLFPLGSMVELSSGEQAKVIRRPHDGFAAPVLLGTDGQRIELENTSLEIARPVRSGTSSSQIRLPQDVMQSIDWHPSRSLNATGTPA